MKERKLRIEDALSATRAAVEEGISWRRRCFSQCSSWFEEPQS